MASQKLATLIRLINGMDSINIYTEIRKCEYIHLYIYIYTVYYISVLVANGYVSFSLGIHCIYELRVSSNISVQIGPKMSENFRHFDHQLS